MSFLFVTEGGTLFPGSFVVSGIAGWLEGPIAGALVTSGVLLLSFAFACGFSVTLACEGPSEAAKKEK